MSRRPAVAVASGAAVLLVALAAAIAVGYPSGYGRDAEAAPGPRVLYLAEPRGPVPADRVLVDHGVRVVRSPQELRAGFDPAATLGIIVDREALPSVDRGWLGRRYRDGVLLVAVDTPVGDLVTAAGVKEALSEVPAPQDDVRPSIPENFADGLNEPFASYVYRATDGDSQLGGAGYIPLREPVFSIIMEERLANAQGIVTYQDGTRGPAWE